MPSADFSWTVFANPIDWALVAIVLLGAFGGWRRGFVAGALQLLTLVVAVVVAFGAYTPAATWLEARTSQLQEWAVPAAFLLVFAITFIGFGALMRAAIRATPPRVHTHRVNKLLGLLPGAVNGFITATLAAVLLLTLPLFDRVSGLARESTLANALAVPAEWAEGRLEPVFEAPLRRALHALILPADTKGLVELPFKVAAPTARPDLEAQMLAMLNAERTQRGLKPLRADPQLTEVARAHSRDMFTRGYFSHSTPDHVDPFDRMRRAQVRFLTAGENLAFAPTLAAAQEDLMKSPGHRANILRPQFGRVGIGIEDGGRHGLMITQNFRN